MKKTYIALGVILVVSCLGYTLVHHKNKAAEIICPTDEMMCPDGTSVKRQGLMCEFDVCKQDIPSYMNIEEASIREVTPSTSTSPSFAPSVTPITNKDTPPSIFSKISQTISTAISAGTEFVQSNISSGIQTTAVSPGASTQSAPTPSNQTASTISNTSSINETRYGIADGHIINENNQIIYTLSGIPSTSTSSSTENWETHAVNAVPINDVAPVVGGIPVQGLPGKFYLSENSFGNIENCEFSNKIYILDTITNERTLMYEENSSTLSKEDSRSCNNEIYLLATDEEKLILKYHTINTNMVCESSWSEPEKTWYLDVTNLQARTKRFVISNSLYTQAEAEESACRLELGEEVPAATP